MKNDSTLADRLRLVMQDTGMTNAEINGALDKVDYVSQIMFGNVKNPSDKLMDYLAAVYNVNPIWLRSGESQMYLEGGKTNQPENADILRMLYLLDKKDQDAFARLVTSMAKKD